jgi:hypothetical protein
VLLGGEHDSTTLPATRVVLHRVGKQLQGPVDSTLTDARGRFRFRYPSDTSALFLASARYAGIEYFTPPFRSLPGLSDSSLLIVVSDTSSGVLVTLEARHIVVSRPAKDGTRSVLEIVVLANVGSRTRIAADSLRPAWAGRIPSGVVGFGARESDVSPESVQQRNDSVLIFAPVAPGQKQIAYSYTLPASRHAIVFPVDQPAAALNLLLEEFDARVAAPGLTRADSQTIEGRRFLRWSGAGIVGSAVTVRFTPGFGALVLPILVGAIGLALVVGVWWWSRRAPSHAAAPAPEALLDAIARLDAKYLGRQQDVSAAEWQKYEADRARLKAEAGRRLAGSGTGS